jgi:hypothetical protein
MKYKWIEKAICEYYYEQETGKIVASISKSSFSDEIWDARINGDHLGQYIKYDMAKKAVEKKVKEIDECYSELRKHEIK